MRSLHWRAFSERAWSKDRPERSSLGKNDAIDLPVREKKTTAHNAMQNVCVETTKNIVQIPDYTDPH